MSQENNKIQNNAKNLDFLHQLFAAGSGTLTVFTFTQLSTSLILLPWAMAFSFIATIFVIIGVLCAMYSNKIITIPTEDIYGKMRQYIFHHFNLISMYISGVCFILSLFLIVLQGFYK